MLQENNNNKFVAQFSVNDARYQVLAKLVKKARVDAGLTMRDLGIIMQKPHSFVGKVENAERRLDVIELYDYCRALNLNVAALMKELSEKLGAK